MDVSLPISNSEYGTKEYWDQRYEKEDHFDWCKKYSDFKHLLKGVLKKGDRILILGCGNSSLSEDLFNDGYTDITNTDYSDVVLTRMANRSELTRQMQWTTMSVTNLTFRESSFDAVIEKATLDALLVQEKDPWQLTAATTKLMENVMQRISNILTPDGHFISITFSQPHFRRGIYCHVKYDWSYSCQTYGSDFHFFFYVMTKGQNLDPKFILSYKPCDDATRLMTVATCSYDENYLNSIDDSLF